MFPCEYCEIFINSLFYRTPLLAEFENSGNVKETKQKNQNCSNNINNIFAFVLIIYLFLAFLTLCLLLVPLFKKDISIRLVILQKYNDTSWQVHEPNNNQDNIHFSVHFFLYVDNPLVSIIILKKLCHSSTPRFIWKFLFVLNKLIQLHFTFFFCTVSV